MALLDFPHINKRQIKSHGGIQNSNLSDADKFNYNVRELRILLNKLSKGNFNIELIVIGTPFPLGCEQRRLYKGRV